MWWYKILRKLYQLAKHAKNRRNMYIWHIKMKTRERLKWNQNSDPDTWHHKCMWYIWNIHFVLHGCKIVRIWYDLCSVNSATKKLLEKLPDLIKTTKKDGFSALHVAAVNDHKDIAVTLMSKV
jgi:hypothetical protein